MISTRSIPRTFEYLFVIIFVICFFISLLSTSITYSKPHRSSLSSNKKKTALKKRNKRRSLRKKKLARKKKGPKKRKIKRVRTTSEKGGVHWRINSKQGIIHVYRPWGFRLKSGGIVVYVHGYRSSADKTWNKRGIAEQFRRSKQNAIFIVIDAPSYKGANVNFPALSKLLTLVMRYTKMRLPRGHIVAIGHSAAYRTIVKWLDYRYLDHVILVDALYARGKEFYHWMSTHKYKAWHKLIVISYDTRKQTETFLKRFKYVVKRKSIPKSYYQFTKREKRTRLLYLQSQYGHRQLITNRKVLPLLLRLTRLRLK